ncbi:MAG: hypothetical protein P5702_14890 [Limnospira sp. PMC 1291.21]|uniref:Uncharacterized protein n=1 Tax=Limnospira fusiformis PMC 851.14 TaxID=2219512 RepID=A0ABU9EKH3_LIMFS|nr:MULTISPECIES: hypothetical protein [Limnospira]MDC0836941.1 hypothetical protein [Limnoraphis robusta]MDT9285156.1 hypothetical protein [Limnospira sp. PMC 1298.21]MDT9316806.1 hypothetical protein [Limnospira sp. PMC 1306.21]MDY7054467.1 hypothetical protein [Limnospira fusiformis LS22]QJB24365.1 hypothetical protein HFV01_04945 [Limnospira fusiformis SAG 85.79]
MQHKSKQKTISVWGLTCGDVYAIIITMEKGGGIYKLKSMVKLIDSAANQ